MGEARKDALRVNLDKNLKLEFHGVKVTSDAGLLVYREIGDVFRLTNMAACELRYNRTGKNTQHSVTALLRQSVYSRLAGYEDTNDAQRLSVDPAMRQIAGQNAPLR
ncbi:MAG: transposase [Planctomycetota bacterium]